MPLSKSLSNKQAAEELWTSYRRDGKIGDTRPRNKAHASRIIRAILYSRSHPEAKK